MTEEELRQEHSSLVALYQAKLRALVNMSRDEDTSLPNGPRYDGVLADNNEIKRKIDELASTRIAIGEVLSAIERKQQS